LPTLLLHADSNIPNPKTTVSPANAVIFISASLFLRHE
jgi:hypothetical protein